MYPLDCCLDKSVQFLFSFSTDNLGQVLCLPFNAGEEIYFKYHHLSPDSDVMFSVYPQPLLVHESAMLG